MIAGMARDLMCHATNLFFEARGESPLGQRWVLDVVKNRVNASEFPSTYCDVITQKNQFEWYTRWKKVLPKDPLLWEKVIVEHYADDPYELRAWRRSFVEAFNHYYYGNVEGDVANGAQFYMTVELYERRGKKPFNNTQVVSIVDSHIFFKPCEGRRSCLNF